ncbi:hypothetical protein EC973_006404 [Apophysomyces ossiformis]|uniref:Uncharacterized protein n=1 Tax=Apophysomyces ossiformis TaxID=679940 RepID=A0A8H7BVY3_9FUNG|nr:hypothetical protein EC973_006404 [Apophysomyces ossiformis]
MRFWNQRAELDVLLNTDRQVTSLISTMKDRRLRSMEAGARAMEPESSPSTSSSDARVSVDSSMTSDAAQDCQPLDALISDADSINADAPQNCQLPDASTSDADSINGDAPQDRQPLDASTSVDIPWLFKGHDVTKYFQIYRSAARTLITKHKKLPPESYINELAALTHVLVINKHQHSPLAMKIFPPCLLDDLAASLCQESIDLDIEFDDEHFLTLTKIVTQLSMGTASRDDTFENLIVMAAKFNYCQKRVIRAIANLVQKLPTTPLKDNSVIGENELCNTYHDPILSSLISDPDRQVHLRWTNTLPAGEGGKSRPDVILSEKRQLQYETTIGHGEAKRFQGSASNFNLCMDTLRLIIFNKNAIDVNTLNAAIAFQIHGFSITFFLARLVASGTYVYYEIARFRLPQSLEDLHTFVTLKNLKLLLAVNDVVWRLCKRSDNPHSISSWYRETLPGLQDLVEKSKDQTRTCVMHFGQ